MQQRLKEQESSLSGLTAEAMRLELEREKLLLETVSFFFFLYKLLLKTELFCCTSSVLFLDVGDCNWGWFVFLLNLRSFMYSSLFVCKRQSLFGLV